MGKKSELSASQRQEIVLMMLRREEPISVLARRYSVSETTLHRCRDGFLTARQAVLAYGRGKQASAQAERVRQLERDVAKRDQVIGELTIANRILKKRWATRSQPRLAGQCQRDDDSRRHNTVDPRTGGVVASGVVWIAWRSHSGRSLPSYEPHTAHRVVACRCPHGLSASPSSPVASTSPSPPGWPEGHSTLRPRGAGGAPASPEPASSSPRRADDPSSLHHMRPRHNCPTHPPCQKPEECLLRTSLDVIHRLRVLTSNTSLSIIATMNILIIKTVALGDVLRTTCILPGLKQRFPSSRIAWLTASQAVDLIAHNSDVDRVESVDPSDPNSVRDAGTRLAETRWHYVLSLEEEEGLCRVASMLAPVSQSGTILFGTYCDHRGKRGYTPDASLWFDMSLISIHGMAEADRLKKQNVESYAAIYARMLGIVPGKPTLPLPNAAVAIAQEAYSHMHLDTRCAVIGLNTSAGSRWQSKRLPEDRVVAIACELHMRLRGRVSFVLLGGRLEDEYNTRIRMLLGNQVHVVDGGAHRSLLEFAAIIDCLDLLVASDTLATHIAIARSVPVVCFFAPTSATEIALYGRGEKVISLSDDYCSYKTSADNSTITAERLTAACLRVLVTCSRKLIQVKRESLTTLLSEGDSDEAVYTRSDCIEVAAG